MPRRQVSSPLYTAHKDGGADGGAGGGRATTQRRRQIDL
jgi:hypothetical protein